MFRCPACAKVTKLPLTKGHTLLAHKDLNRWTIEKTPVSIPGKVAEVTSLSDLIDKLNEHGLELDAQGDNYLECYICQVASKFEAWVKAWDFPGDFFDADQLCGCGGELWFDKIIGSNRFALQCETCGWIKPRAVISGHE